MKHPVVMFEYIVMAIAISLGFGVTHCYAFDEKNSNDAKPAYFDESKDLKRGYWVEANYAEDFSPEGPCNPTASWAIYVGRAVKVNSNLNLGKMELEKCGDLLPPDADRMVWIAVGESVNPDPNLLDAYVIRKTGTWPADAESFTMEGIRIWPSKAELQRAECDSEKHLFIITDGNDRPGEKGWYQYEAVTFTKRCD